ncbi:MAG: hypothetical protein R3C56_06620 [Pirellulaceae bacterium]
MADVAESQGTLLADASEQAKDYYQTYKLSNGQTEGSEPLKDAEDLNERRTTRRSHSLALAGIQGPCQEW